MCLCRNPTQYPANPLKNINLNKQILNLVLLTFNLEVGIFGVVGIEAPTHDFEAHNWHQHKH
jgi:hypothetical protein